MRPHRNSRGIGGLPPLHFLDHFGVGLLDENSDPSERLAPPITQLLDSRIYQLRGGVSSFSFLRAALPLLHGCCRWQPAAAPTMGPRATAPPSAADRCPKKARRRRRSKASRTRRGQPPARLAGAR